MNIPRDPIMLMSYLNTQLRDNYPDFDELCQSLVLDPDAITATLATAGYTYNPSTNQFTQRKT